MFNSHDILQIIVYLGLLVGLTPVLGTFMYKVYSGENHFLLPVFGRFERWIYIVTGSDPLTESDWKGYLSDLLKFNFFGFVFLFLIQVFQSILPFNPEKLTNIPWHSAFNTAVSFVTNTNWQNYGGENTMSYFVQMAGLTVQNFVSAATGIAVLLAVIRGLVRKTTYKIGNFWIDMTRSVLYILLPLSIALTVLLVSQGVVQNLKSYEKIKTLQGSEQVLPMGPAASQVAVKQLGTNGGGFFNANSAHPFENPTPFSNLLEMMSILLIPAALTFTFGKMIGNQRHGWAVFTVMFILMVTGLAISLRAEFSGNSLFGNAAMLEGKEVRNGVTNSILWSVTTTDASNGSVNAMHDSLTPVSGMIALMNVMLGEAIFGGVGSGLYGMIIFIILTVFIAGLMVGRTPEYLGKKIEAFEIKMAIIGAFAPSLVILVFSAVAVTVKAGLSGMSNPGPHGLSQVLYAFSSAAGNNGSAFAGLSANTVFYNLMTGIGMLIGRFGVIIPAIAIAGSLAGKKAIPFSSGTFRTDDWLFIVLLIAVILIVGGLTFFPALSMGPIVENLLLKSGVTF
jgi:K+-transporting ATPase ATPase A chain